MITDVHLFRPNETPNVQALKEIPRNLQTVLAAAIEGKESRMVEEVVSCMRGNLSDEEVRWNVGVQVMVQPLFMVGVSSFPIYRFWLHTRAGFSPYEGCSEIL